jgi:hypothetical protein
VENPDLSSIAAERGINAAEKANHFKIHLAGEHVGDSG